ncbi:hypothetical protein C0Q70_08939 [Pomacea canaliculata]|uniref:C2H2-type domain-containing protein n=1 Tax=Pomacea canaliculata TaxID=400727 RepID=A0A2T7P8E2_POMCA|nr:hypothetical protein C0Q70_08939 [Pomacea canaliculata]
MSGLLEGSWKSPSATDPLGQWFAPESAPADPLQLSPMSYRRPRRCSAGNQCRNCGKTYRQSQHMLRHRRQCEGTFQLQCGTCGKGFSRRDLYNQHLRIHRR